MRKRIEYIFKIKKILGFLLIQKPRILFYSILSVKPKNGIRYKKKQPVLIYGLGNVNIGKSVFGTQQSPFFFSGYTYIEARTLESNITIGDNTMTNNNLSIICNVGEIRIGSNVLIGSNVEIYNSDFHNLSPKDRHKAHTKGEDIIIEDNVFLGSNVKVLKGVTIGKNSVIAQGSLVTKSIPANVIAAGIPCKVIKKL